MPDKMVNKTRHVRLTGRLVCRNASDIELVQTHLAEHVRLTRTEPGCVSFEVFQSEDPLIWDVEECFLDKEAYEFHQKRTRASLWWAATAGIPRDYTVTGLE